MTADVEKLIQVIKTHGVSSYLVVSQVRGDGYGQGIDNMGTFCLH